MDDNHLSIRLTNLESRFARLEETVSDLAKATTEQGVIVPLIHEDLRGIKRAVESLTTQMATGKASASMLLAGVSLAASGISAALVLLFKRVFNVD
jgi:uncharacterized coiled-coil protein SlyX